MYPPADSPPVRSRPAAELTFGVLEQPLGDGNAVIGTGWERVLGCQPVVDGHHRQVVPIAQHLVADVAHLRLADDHAPAVEVQVHGAGRSVGSKDAATNAGDLLIDRARNRNHQALEHLATLPRPCQRIRWERARADQRRHPLGDPVGYRLACLVPHLLDLIGPQPHGASPFRRPGLQPATGDPLVVSALPTILIDHTVGR